MLSDYSYYDSEEDEADAVDDEEYTQVFDEPPNANVVETIQNNHNLILYTQDVVEGKLNPSAQIINQQSLQNSL